MNKIFYLFIVGIIVPFYLVSAQVGYNANERVTSYGNKEKEFFLYGANMAWRNINWSDEMMGTILCSDPTGYGSEGPNANSLRPALYDRFVAQYGIDYRIPTFEHYASKGAKVNTIFLSGPRDAYKERICPLNADEEKLDYELPASFKNLYEPIWKVENGVTVVNQDNYYARYVYDVVSGFKSYTRFWEVWNEPDLTYNGNGDKEPGQANNWWDSDPDPCELHNLRAPVQHYIRLLRISYEVIKSIDEDAVICTGGLGYSSFLDAILRNTDNPDGGKATPEYPYKGGAYFDCVSYHVYPMYYLRKWTGRDAQHPDGFTYFRHTDAAVEAAVNHQKKMENVLNKHGYNGSTYPEKEWILSETNIPGKRVVGTDDNGKKWFIGSDEAQRNYLTKVAIACQKNDVNAIYVYCPYDNDKAGSEAEYDVMGFYEPLPETPGSKLTLKPAGKAWRTMVKLLAERRYSAEETNKLGLNSSMWKDKIDGGAFYSSETKDYIYVLWAKTSKDLDETASITYTFPSSGKIQSVTYTNWDETTVQVKGGEVMLTGSPVFITVSEGDYIDILSISLDKKTLALETGKTMTLKAAIEPENASNKELVWRSADTSIASVSNTGNIFAYKPGTVQIIVSSADNQMISDTCTVTVSGDPVTVPVSGISITPSSMELIVGESSEFIATILPENANNKNILWKSSADTVVMVDPDGKITSLKAGIAYINARSMENNSVFAVGKVTVKESAYIPVREVSMTKSASLYQGGKDKLTATILPANATNKSIAWKSSADTIVIVDSEGRITGLRTGIAYINARSMEDNSVFAVCKVTVLEGKNPIIPVEKVVVEKSVSLYAGSSRELVVTIEPADATNKGLAWSTSNHKIVSVDSGGKITGLMVGVAYVTAKSVEDNTILNACKVTVVENVQRSDPGLGHDSSLKLYPNPVNDRLYISGTREGELIGIYTLNGILMHTTNAQDGETTIEFSRFAEGVYLIKIRGESKKVIKN